MAIHNNGDTGKWAKEIKDIVSSIESDLDALQGLVSDFECCFDEQINEAECLEGEVSDLEEQVANLEAQLSLT